MAVMAVIICPCSFAFGSTNLETEALQAIEHAQPDPAKSHKAPAADRAATPATVAIEPIVLSGEGDGPMVAISLMLRPMRISGERKLGNLDVPDKDSGVAAQALSYSGDNFASSQFYEGEIQVGFWNRKLYDRPLSLGLKAGLGYGSTAGQITVPSSGYTFSDLRFSVIESKLGLFAMYPLWRSVFFETGISWQMTQSILTGKSDFTRDAFTQSQGIVDLGMTWRVWEPVSLTLQTQLTLASAEDQLRLNPSPAVGVKAIW